MIERRWLHALGCMLALGCNGAIQVGDWPDAASPRIPCPIPDGIFCDDFERVDSLDRVWDGVSVVNGTAVSSDATVHSGARALRADIVGGHVNRAFVSTPLEPAGAAEIWLRFWIFIPSTTELESIFVAYLRSVEDFSASVGIREGQFLLDYLGGEIEEPAEGTVPTDAWTCVVLHVTPGSSGEMELFVSGTRVAVLSPVVLDVAGFDHLSFGIVRTQATQPAATLFGDDLLLSRIPLTCP